MHPGFVIGKEQDDNKNNNNNNNHQLTNPHCLSICRFFCVVSGAGQNNCSSRAEPYVPNSGLYYFGEILVSLLGVVLFLSFGANQEVFDFWRQIFKDNFSRVVKIPPTNEQANRIQLSSERAKCKESKTISFGTTDEYEMSELSKPLGGVDDRLFCGRKKKKLKISSSSFRKSNY